MGQVIEEEKEKKQTKSRKPYDALKQLEGFYKTSKQSKHQTPPQVRSGNWETYGN